MNTELLEVLQTGSLEKVQEYLRQAEPSPQALAEGMVFALSHFEDALALGLLEAGADPNALLCEPDYEGGPRMTPFGLMLRGSTSQSDEETLRLIEAFLARGARPDVRDEVRRTQTPLYEVAGAGKPASTRRLLEAGADPNLTVGKVGTALCAVCEASELAAEVRRDVLEALLQFGADPNVEARGRAPLWHVARRGELESVRHLLDAGASAQAADRQGVTAVQIAADHGHGEVVVLLVQRGADAGVWVERARLVAAAAAERWSEVSKLAARVAEALPTQPDTYIWASRACAALEHAAGALSWAERGVQQAFHPQVLTRLVHELLRQSRAAEAIDAWQAHRAKLDPKTVDPFLIANLIAAYSVTNQHADGLAQLETWIAANPSRGDQGLLRFNAACLYTKNGRLEEALRLAYDALGAGKDLRSFETDGDLEALRAHPAYPTLAAVGPRPGASFAFAYAADGGEQVELRLRTNELERRVYRPGEAFPHEVSTRTCDDAFAATLAFAQQTHGHPQVASPATAQWVAGLREAAICFAALQAAGQLDPIGGLVIEWDFGETERERLLWIGAYGPVEDPRAFDAGVGSDDVQAEFIWTAPPLETAPAFEAVVRAFSRTEAYAGLRAQAPCYFVLQEHDAGHIATVRLPEGE